MTTTIPAPTGALVPQRRLNLISVVLVLGVFTTLLDATIVNIAIDHLHTVFNASVARTQWVATAYLLLYVAVIPVSGWASERFGARNVWAFAVAAFLVGSALCASASSLPMLIAFRALQGTGGGMLIPLSFSMLTRAAGPERIGKAMIAIALPAQLAPVLGSVLGGLILQYWSWQWMFLVNVPVCIAALTLVRFLPAVPGRPGDRLDVLGLILLTPGVIALAYGVSEAAGANGFAAVSAWLPLLIGTVLIAAFVRHSLASRRKPLIDVRLFARRSFGLSSIITFMAGFSTYALTLLLPLFYQQLRGESVLTTGLLLIPQGAGTTLFFLLARPLVAKLDGRLVVAGGIALTMIGILPFTFADLHGGELLLLAGQLLQGIGFGAATYPVMTLAFGSLSHEETPSGSAAFSVVQRVGAPFGVAVIAVILQNHLKTAHTPSQVLSGFADAFWWTFGLGTIPLALAFLIPRKHNQVRKEDTVLDANELGPAAE
ncbi:multidrug efflux MFS transporter [Catenulispora sp. NL8]|uniref:Multidrug efflux MFS transporter n=1 Tax=Catenulispora pinistramenti TaxID=2705254 RepID=A0ABS5KLK9_9ACTN|nr:MULTISPECIES: MDR family MFS transporter [Catenulispora]MBS2546930.1 multidrug efflux MFS transporter [Catenulispora pinistramenti]